MRLILFGMVMFAVMNPPPAFAKGNVVTIRILAVNPTDAELNTVVTHRLPPEIQPEHVIDAAGMQIQYDTNLVTYYLTLPVVLAPKETRTIQVKVRNVWQIGPEQIDSVRQKLEQTISALQGTRYHDTAMSLSEKAMSQITRIEEEQAMDMGIKRQIEIYRSHVLQLRQIETGLLSLSALRKLAIQSEDGIRTTKFVIRAKNPSDERMKMTVRAYLPKEITSLDVINKLDFQLLYDSDKERFYIENEDNFEPREEKKYEITLRDVWHISKAELDFLRDQSEKLLSRFKGTPYLQFAEQTVQSIIEILDSVWNLQQEVQESEAIEDRIRAFVINHQRLELVKKKIKELQDLLLEIPQKEQSTEIDQIKDAVVELSKMFEILSLGFTPDLSTTWWIILGIIGFLFIFSTSFYVTWLMEIITKTKTVRKRYE